MFKLELLLTPLFSGAFPDSAFAADNLVFATGSRNYCQRTVRSRSFTYGLYRSGRSKGNDLTSRVATSPLENTLLPRGLWYRMEVV